MNNKSEFKAVLPQRRSLRGRDLPADRAAAHGRGGAELGRRRHKQGLHRRAPAPTDPARRPQRDRKSVV